MLLTTLDQHYPWKPRDGVKQIFQRTEGKHKHKKMKDWPVLLEHFELENTEICFGAMSRFLSIAVLLT